MRATDAILRIPAGTKSWAARDGQFEDLDTPQNTALFDDLPAWDGGAAAEDRAN
jgi:nitrogen fixation-related uncharacterized protein